MTDADSRARTKFPEWDGIEERLAKSASGLGLPFTWTYETSSTSDVAKRAAREGAPHGALWVSETQTAGRGRQGRTWLAGAGQGILMSVLLRTNVRAERVPPLSLAVGLSLRDVFEAATGIPDVLLKWPNDVLAHGKKVAGILVETIVSGANVDAIVVGVGMNIHTREFPDEIAHRATSLACASANGATLHRGDLLISFLEKLAVDSDHVLHRGLGPFRARLERADALRGKRVRKDDGVSGTASGIHESGGLLVDVGEGRPREVWSSGEVHLVLDDAP